VPRSFSRAWVHLVKTSAGTGDQRWWRLRVFLSPTAQYRNPFSGNEQTRDAKRCLIQAWGGNYGTGVTDASLLFFPYTFLLRARMECTAFRNSLISSSRIARIAREFKWKTKSAMLLSPFHIFLETSPAVFVSSSDIVLLYVSRVIYIRD